MPKKCVLYGIITSLLLIGSVQAQKTVSGAAEKYLEIALGIDSSNTTLHSDILRGKSPKIPLPFKSKDKDFYTKIINGKIIPFLTNFPDSPLAQNVAELKNVLENELDQVSKNKIRVDKTWISNEEYQLLKVNYNCLEFIDKIKVITTPYPIDKYFEELNLYKTSSYYPQAVEALRQALVTIKRNLSSESSSASPEMVLLKNKLRENEEALFAIYNVRVTELKGGAWGSEKTSTTPKGKTYYLNDARPPEQDEQLKEVTQYLFNGSFNKEIYGSKSAMDLPLAKLSDVDMQKIHVYYMAIQEKLKSVTSILSKDGKLSAVVAMYEEKERAINNLPIDSITDILNSYRSFKVNFEALSNSAYSISEMNKIVAQAKYLLGNPGNTNVDIQNTFLDIAAYNIDSAEKFIQTDRIHEVPAILAFADYFLSSIHSTGSNDAILKKKELIKGKIFPVNDAIEKNKSLQAEKMQNTIQLQEKIHTLHNAKKFKELQDLRTEISSAGLEDKYTSLFEEVDRKMNQSDDRIKLFLSKYSEKNFDMMGENIGEAVSLWPGNPKLAEIQKQIAADYHDTFEKKNYKECQQWLAVAEAALMDSSLLNTHYESDIVKTEIENEKKFALYRNIGISLSALLVLVIFIKKCF